MYKCLQFFILSGTLVWSALLYAYQLNGSAAHAVALSNPLLSLTGSLPSTKKVYLMKINLTSEEKAAIVKPQANDKTSTFDYLASAGQRLPWQIDLGMNGVPVLDQGKHGSCVTFAVTAAIDAVLGKGDYVSQLCSLELGSYLASKSYLYSGWNGSYGAIVLHQLTGFGIVNIKNQKKMGCAGVKEYPLHDENNTGQPMSLDEYANLRETPSINYATILDGNDRFSNFNGNEILNKVKQTLAEGHRIVFATLIPVAYCSVGACARYHSRFDTWAYTPAMAKDKNPELQGHELVIIGYNDRVIVADNEGKSHQGIFVLRNSWSSDVGDKGNYYMTYDYFKKFVIEAYKIEK